MADVNEFEAADNPPELGGEAEVEDGIGNGPDGEKLADAQAVSLQTCLLSVCLHFVHLCPGVFPRTFLWKAVAFKRSSSVGGQPADRLPCLWLSVLSARQQNVCYWSKLANILKQSVNKSGLVLRRFSKS